MNKLKKLWSQAVFRWSVYQTLLVVFALLLKDGTFDYGLKYDYDRISNRWYNKNSSYNILNWDLESIATLIWILTFAFPAVWVWRKPLLKLAKQTLKLVKQALGFLNRKAEEG